ncbi:MAG: hypothetical protein EBY16_09190 [Gammaproteobacteria bacterium]|nr:hypothetical protein [Gammaproteobacteria bacterium]
MAKKVAGKDAYEVEVVFKIRKTWTVVAESEEEAVEKLQESGIVNSNCESGDEYYNEDYEVLRIVQVEEPDVD